MAKLERKVMLQLWEKLLEMCKKYFVAFLLLLLILLVNRSLLHEGFFHLHDFTHAARIAEMGRALLTGQFPVRWSPNLGYGFGMPLFLFYAPLPYFLGALFWLSGFSVLTSIKLLYFLLTLITVLGSYRLGKSLAGRSAGLLLAFFYTLAPYRAVNLFVRGALSEALAMAFFPWVILGIWQLLKKFEKRYFFLLTLSLAAIMLSHNLSALMFYPLSGFLAFLLCLQKENFRIFPAFKRLLPIFLAYLTAFGLTAFYSIPAVVEKDQTIIQSIFSGYFAYNNHFLYIRQFLRDSWGYGGSEWGPNDGISFFFGYAQWLGLALVTLSFFVLIWKSWRKRSKQFLHSQTFLFLLSSFFFVGLTAFLSLLKSEFLWEKLSLLQYIQFPWRWLASTAFFLALLVAFLPRFLKKAWLRYGITAILLVIALFNLTYFQPESYLANADALYYSDPQRIRQEMSEILPDYIPSQMAEQETLKLLASDQNLAGAASKSADVEITPLIDQGFQYLLDVKASSDSQIVWHVANFPGWQAEIDEKSIPVQTSELGTILLDVPTGQHTVSLRFTENTPDRIFADILTLLTILAFSYFLAPFREEKSKQEKTI
jgi:4-amino-4-deoxy-L-arabinose transferase-like glycosyltransferase